MKTAAILTVRGVLIVALVTAAALFLAALEVVEYFERRLAPDVHPESWS